MPEPMEYDPELHHPPPVFDVHKAALQEIDRVVGNQLTLDESETTRLRGILAAGLSERPRAAVSAELESLLREGSSTEGGADAAG